MIKNQYRELEKRALTREQAIARLDDIVGILRKECPWDREQDHKSLRICMIEEAYEVAEAIDKEDDLNLREELGDVLLQVIFHASLAEKDGKFDFIDVVNEECEKMIRRHPHVFLDEEAKTVDKVLEKWENIKVREHGDSSCTERLNSVPDALPALIRSYKVQKKAAESVTDREDVDCAFAQLAEDTKELIKAGRNSDNETIVEKLGDLLFSTVNVSRSMGIEPEAALEQATGRFIRRFEYVEQKVEESGDSLKDIDKAKLDVLRDDAKQKIGS
ncbi:MAG: nucleoside triphosphate pyrophosphohydrolase [Eubacteriaceae bacterium]|nr:nucleoside triphosphate pyrophosphohydrolase [Eubacteriaceae bacterium]